MRSRRFTTLLTLWVAATGSPIFCHADGVTAPDGVAYFETHIRPLLAKHCYECHSARSGAREGGLLLDSRAGWITGGGQGPAVSPGSADTSLLIQAVRYTNRDLQMPPDQPLSAHAVARLEQWVQMGAPDPRDEATTGTKPAARPSDPIRGRDHWSYRPLSPMRLPPIKAQDWPRSPIDHFILAQLEESHLQPTADARPRALLRRAYVQLTGLPPTPQVVNSFLNDQHPDAFQRQVDRLLTTWQYGEYWGRHWLDLARYADSNGLDENFLFREAWRYRNWVIAATNRDVPFDRFVLEQIAGDSLPYDSIAQRDRQRIAAGFLVVGPKVLLGNDGSKQRMEVADEQIDTIGRAILGQTLGCARCHDHKFDPIPTVDYYAMAGILTSTQVMERRYMLGQQRVMERLVGLGTEGDGQNNDYEKYWRDRPNLKARLDHAKSALKLLTQEDTEALDALMEKHADALSDLAKDVDMTNETRLVAQQAFVAKLESTLKHPPKIPPRGMIPTDVDAPTDEAVRISGQFDRAGKKVSRGFLQVVSHRRAKIPAGTSGRVELAQWITDTQHGAGHLTARVMANRIWHNLIGRGLVRTVDNFGRTGEAPSHPQLLDYLAARLIRSGWSTKSVVREIILSRTFALSSQHQEAGHAVDPDNRRLWRANRRRLTAEALRDAMLMASGQLNLASTDSTVWYLGDQATAVGSNANRRRTDFPCRSVYLPVIRNDLPELFQVFNFADPHATTGARPQTVVATQGLYILNDDQVMAAADALARQVLTAEWRESASDRVNRLFERLFNATPTDEERRDLLGFIAKTRKQLMEDGQSEPNTQAWSIACHALFSLSRFQFLE